MHHRARRDDLVFTEVEDQLVIYDTLAHVTHCLNPAAALVWRLADGSRDEAALAAALAAGHGPDGAPSLLALALERLRECGLVESPGAPLHSRRELIRMAGVASAAALVTTVVVPGVAAAVSCLPNGATCGGASPTSCCPGCSCDGTCFGTCA